MCIGNHRGRQLSQSNRPPNCCALGRWALRPCLISARPCGPLQPPQNVAAITTVIRGQHAPADIPIVDVPAARAPQVVFRQIVDLPPVVRDVDVSAPLESRSPEPISEPALRSSLE